MKISEKGQKILFFILPIFTLLYIWRHIVFTDNIFYNGDILFNLYPFFDYFSKDSPFIIQNILSGFPGFVTVTGIWFYPINKLFLTILNPIDVYKYTAVLYMVLTYIFTYLYSRKINFSHATGIFIATIFTFSGQLMLWADVPFITASYFLLPLSLYLVEYFIDIKNKKKFIFLISSGIVLGVGWLSGHTQFVIYTHLFFFIYLLFRSKSFLTSIIPFFASILIGLPQIFATLSFKSETVRSGGVSINDLFLGSYLPQDIAHYFLPFLNIPFVNGSHNLYIGVLPIILLIFSFFLVKKISHNLYKFYFFVFIFSILASFKYSPIAFMFHLAPVLDSLREAPRIMFIGNFASAFLVGFCIDYVLENRENIYSFLRKYLNILTRIFVWTLLPLIVIFSILKLFFMDTLFSFANSYFINNLYENTAKFPIDYYRTIIKLEVNRIINQFYIGNFEVLLLLFFFILSVVLLYKIKNIPPEKFMYLAILLVSFNFALVYSEYYPVIPKGDYISVPETVRFIKNRESTNKYNYRIYSLFPNDTVFKEQVRCGIKDPSESLAIQKELVVPNLSILYGVDALDGYDQYTPRNISIITALLGSERSPTGPILANEKISMEDKVKKVVSMKSKLQMMNVKYVISHYEIKDKYFKQIYKANIGKCGTVVYIYELADYWPRYYVSYGTKKVSVPVLYNKNGMTFDFEIVADNNFYVGNTQLLGWKAYVDGKSVEISTANDIYMSVPIQKGKHKVVFVYNEAPSLLSWLK